MALDSERLKAISDEEIIDWLDKGIGAGGAAAGQAEMQRRLIISITELRDQAAELHADAKKQSESSSC